MGLPVTVYRHTDVGAPIVRPTRPSDWLAVLKACLVTGYGTKQPLGWTLEFEGTYKAAFKNKVSDGGSGCMLRFSDVTGSNPSGGDFDMAMSRNMSDVDTYIDKLQSRRFRTYNNAAGVKGWTIIGTSRGFWMISVNSTTGSLDTLQTYFLHNAFFGDVESFIPNDISSFGMLTGVSTTGDSTNISSSYMIGTSDGMYITHLAADGSSGKVEYSYLYNNKLTTVDGGDIGTTNVPAVLNTPLLVGIAGNGNPAFNLCRGKIPGLHELQHAGCKYVNYPILRTFDGIEYEAIVGAKVPIFWIQVSGNWYE
ncbi:hypothetical protein ACRN9C_03585 [Shewanella frigidimarina]|uniref:hypothetical protein n=1 Tax=Shewanella frigidimarina TaxID=56812 RepID=UPI003D7A3C40